MQLLLVHDAGGAGDQLGMLDALPKNLAHEAGPPRHSFFSGGDGYFSDE